MKNNNIIIFFILIIISISSFGQYSDQYLLKKYWSYRARFNQNFIRIGSGRGLSTPVVSRVNKDEITLPNGAYNPDHPTGKIYFGDGTLHLGHYIGMLATEYGLLMNKYFSNTTLNYSYYVMAQNTLKELAYALLAFDRLDYLPDKSLNGFFVRDDANDSLGHLFKLNPTDPPYIVESDYKSCNIANMPNLGSVGNGCYGKGKSSAYNSWEHQLGIMLGCALVYKIVGSAEYVNLHNVPDPTNLLNIIPTIVIYPRNKAKEIADRIYNYLQNNSASNCACSLVPTCNGKMKNILYDLYGTDKGFSQEWLFIPPSAVLGHAVKFTWKGYRVAYKTIFDNTVPHKLASEYYAGFRAAAYPFSTNGSNLGIAMDILALSNNRYKFCSGTNKAEELMGIWVDSYYLEMYDILRAVLHDTNTDKDKSFHQRILNSAPCDGPAIGSINGWCEDSRWMSFFKIPAACNNTHNNQGHYYHNGIDYMLYFNLYAIKFGLDGNGYSFTPYLIANDHASYATEFPFYMLGFGLQGTKAKPFARHHGYTTTTSLVKNNADVRFVATHEVNLNPGFEVELGGDFLAEIRDGFECNPGSHIYNNRSTQNTDQEDEEWIVEQEKELEMLGFEETEIKGNTKVLEKMLSVFPNPSSYNEGVIVVFNGITDSKITLKVLNVNGQTIEYWEEQNTGYLQKKLQLPQGFYIIQAETENSVYHQRIIIL